MPMESPTILGSMTLLSLIHILVHGLVDHIIQKFCLPLQVHGPILNPCDGEQILHQVNEPDGIVINIPVNLMPLALLHLGAAV